MYTRLYGLTIDSSASRAATKFTTGLSRQDSSFACQNTAVYTWIWNHAMHACMGHRAAARSLLAIAAKLPSLSAAEHTQKARCSWAGWSNPRSVQTNLPWHGLKITKLPGTSWVLEKKNPTYGARKFKVQKSTRPGQDRLQEVQEVSKTCSGVRFGQPDTDHRGSKSAARLGQISL